MGQGNQTAFAGGIRFTMGLRLQSAGRSDIDDGAATAAQQPGSVLTAEKGPGKVARENVIPCLKRQGFQRGTVSRPVPGIVDQGIEPAEFFAELIHGGRNACLITYVHAKNRQPAITGVLSGQRLAGFYIPVRNGHPHAHRQQLVDDGPADPPGAASDQSHTLFTKPLHAHHPGMFFSAI
jgi:hypothetical protein